MPVSNTVRRSPRPVDRRRSPFRTPRARPTKLGSISKFFQRAKRRAHRSYATAVEAEKSRLLQNVFKAAVQFADAERLGKPLGIYEARLAREERHARESDVVIRPAEIQDAVREGASASDRRTARSIVTGVQRRMEERRAGMRGGSTRARPRRRHQRVRRKTRRRRTRRHLK